MWSNQNNEMLCLKEIKEITNLFYVETQLCNYVKWSEELNNF